MEKESRIGVRPGDLSAGRGRAVELVRESVEWPSVVLDAEQTADLELLVGGGYAPLAGFLGRAQCEAVCLHGRLPEGSPWPVPIVLDIDESQVDGIEPGRPWACAYPMARFWPPFT